MTGDEEHTEPLEPLAWYAPARGVSPHVVISVATEGRDDAGAARAAAALVAKFGCEHIVLPPEMAPSSVGRTADQRDRAIVVLTSSDPGGATRVVDAERACRIAVATRHAVLLASTSTAWPLRRCVAATDFGRPSLTAARVAIGLLEPPAEVVLAFVHQGAPPNEKGDVSMPRHLRLLLNALPHTLVAPGVTITSVVLTGAVLPALLTFARNRGADVLSFGRHGRSTSSGLLGSPLGPTVRGLLLGAPCAALVSSAG